MFNAAIIARAGRAYLAGFVLMTLSVSLAQAEYGPRTTVGNNYQQSSSTLSPNGLNQGNCNGFNCYVLFQRAPQEQSLIIQHVSCAIIVEGTVALVAVGNREGQTLLSTISYIVPVHQAGDVWLVNSPVMHLVRSGERPVIALQSSPGGSWSIICTISGKLQQP